MTKENKNEIKRNDKKMNLKIDKKDGRRDKWNQRKR